MKTTTAFFAKKLFTKRTNHPKLAWLVQECRKAGLRVCVRGRSFHAPISWVHPEDEAAAWEILTPIDDIPDDDPRFAGKGVK